ncbi:acyl-coenzyme A thioesterase THEM4 [Dryobates pubescens]|uniref:acyl-coenzyme A thioesterase THEM4 n=1 Tax=Dryobates pubescens TaxID=118200 RepID=UPI0023B936B7|nr:acyl-coenzyme A thioesterase THEM4 [Dryobates pubescens]
MTCMWQRGAVAVPRALAATGRPCVPCRPCSRPPAEPPQDLAVPNSSWSEPMRRHYQRLLAMTADGAWLRLPSYRRGIQHLPKGVPRAPRGQLPGDTRLFLRAIEAAGAGFEFAMFLNATERRLLCLLQPGPYLEGYPGLIHGGAIATIVDATLGICALAEAGKVVTANLNIDYLVPVPLGTVLLVEGHTERTEGRKLFVGGHVRSADGDTVHARATGEDGDPFGDTLERDTPSLTLTHLFQVSSSSQTPPRTSCQSTAASSHHHRHLCPVSPLLTPASPLVTPVSFLSIPSGDPQVSLGPGPPRVTLYPPITLGSRRCRARGRCHGSGRAVIGGWSRVGGPVEVGRL